MKPPLPARAAELVRQLGLLPHPEGGHYREFFRSPRRVQPADARPGRSALTSIDFLLGPGEHSAWHRVGSDEVWHLLEGGPLRLWLVAPELPAPSEVVLKSGAADAAPRHVVPAGWWQAAEPLGRFAYVGATVGPGFEFEDFDFGRAHAPFTAALAARAPALRRLL